MNPGSYEYETCRRRQLIPYNFNAYQYLKIEVLTKVALFLKSAHISVDITIPSHAHHTEPYSTGPHSHHTPYDMYIATPTHIILPPLTSNPYHCTPTPTIYTYSY